MKKALLLLTTILSFSVPAGSAAVQVSSDLGGVGDNVVVPAQPSGEAASVSRAVASAQDLEKIKANIREYGAKLGLPKNVEPVGDSGCFSWCSTTFGIAERFLLNEVAGQLLTRFLAIALDDLADGQLDGIANGKKVSYAQEVAALLGVSVSEEDLATVPLDESFASRLIGFSIALTTTILQTGGQKDQLIAAAEAFVKDKMDKARKSLAVALIHEADRIITLELADGKMDGIDANGVAIDLKKEMQDSVQRALSRVLDGVM
jgi:hypothetical protein